MGSKSTDIVENDTNNYAVDRSVAIGEGQAIMDSIIESSDPAVIREVLGPTMAAWQNMSKQASLNLFEMVDLGTDVIKMIDKSQIKIGKQQEEMLKASIKNYKALLDQNKLTVDLVDKVADRSFDLTEKSLDLVADVKAGELNGITKSVMVFSLAAMGLVVWAQTKGK